MSYTPYTPLPVLEEPYLREVRRRRLMAWLIDFVVIMALMIVYVLVMLALGLLTFGLSWVMLWFFLPSYVVVAMIYTGFTMGSSAAGTIGMRTMGLELRQANGQPLGFIMAAVHAGLFYLSVGFLTFLVLAVSLISENKRLLHDIVTGTVMVNRV
jgi:uncharacterized RDD family membrane protein YckC